MRATLFQCNPSFVASARWESPAWRRRRRIAAPVMAGCIRRGYARRQPARFPCGQVGGAHALELAGEEVDDGERIAGHDGARAQALQFPLGHAKVLADLVEREQPVHSGCPARQGGHAERLPPLDRRHLAADADGEVAVGEPDGWQQASTARARALCGFSILRGWTDRTDRSRFWWVST
jgi:hypothetical protein